MLNSKTFGNLATPQPVNDVSTRSHIVKINIEIGNTNIIQQHINRRSNYPLPLRRNFNITYNHNSAELTYSTSGHKQIKLFNYGKELVPCTKM